MNRISERLNISILDGVLRNNPSAMLMVSPMILNSIETTLTENDRMTCQLYLSNSIEELMAMLAESVVVAQQAVPDLLKQLCNNDLQKSHSNKNSFINIIN